MTISYTTFQSFRLRQLTGIPLTRICEVASEIAYETLLKDPDLLEATRKEHAVRSPERQLEIDMSRGYERVVPFEYFDFDRDGVDSTLVFQGIWPSQDGA